MGGTIDKDYPKRIGGYAFEIGPPAARTILENVQPSIHVDFLTVCQKDSQDITEQDRHHLYEVCKSSPHTKILITHGTDTMIETATYLAKKQLLKTIFFTGSFLPATFKKTDADFNIGIAIGALQCTSLYNVFVAMNGCVHLWNRVQRCSETDRFVAKL
ncbi:uncharacterized protein [Amphiura filiformis]|uniref:uncharacterized protein n=1 Tax=Amphiura filiformis TaxID=82378 RepID=UPI003B228850